MFGRIVGVLVGGAVALALVVSAHAQDAEIGVAAAVNPRTTGTPPAQAERVLTVGTNVFTQERIVTGERGQTQMLFLDESALTIGPNSDMVLDEFVYDPDAQTGSLVINATKGVFRLVGGKISKKNPVLLKTPTATIGIRGGINYTVIGDNSLQTINGFGQTTVESEGVRITIDRPGYGSTVVPGEPPSLPVLIDAAAMEAAFNSLESSGEASGGSEDPPDDSDVAASGVGEGGSDNDPKCDRAE